MRQRLGWHRSIPPSRTISRASSRAIGCSTGSNPRVRAPCAGGCGASPPERRTFGELLNDTQHFGTRVLVADKCAIISTVPKRHLLIGDGWVLVGPAAFKAVVRRAERLGCVRFARISAKETTSARASPEAGRFSFARNWLTPPWHSQKYLLLTILSNCLVCSQCRHKRHSPPILLLRAIDPIPYANRLSSTKAVANRDNSSTCKEVNRLS